MCTIIINESVSIKDSTKADFLVPPFLQFVRALMLACAARHARTTRTGVQPVVIVASRCNNAPPRRARARGVHALSVKMIEKKRKDVEWTNTLVRGLAGSHGRGASRLVTRMQWGNPRRLWGTDAVRR